MLPRGAAWTVAIVTVVCRSTLSTIVALLLWGVLPNLVGFQTTTVMSGSMTPRLEVGDAVVVRPVDAGQLSDGQVLLFDDPDRAGALRMHRLVRVRSDGELVTKGDANDAADSTTVGSGAVHGAAFLRIPFAGLPNYWVRTDQPVPLLVGGGVVALLLAGVRLGRLLEDPEDRSRRRHRGVRLPGAHRATALGVAILVLPAGAVAAGSPAPARAAYSAVSSVSGNTWGTTCADRTPTNLGAGPVLYWGYGTLSGSDVTDLSGQGDAGTSPSGSDAAPVTCVDGFTPAAQVGMSSGTSKGLIVEKTSRSYPGTVTVATWFKTANPGGVLADFGGSSSVASPSPSTQIDRVLFMQADGNLAFGATTTSVAGLLGNPIFCTSAKPTGYADNGWHLAVASFSYRDGCTLTVDGSSVSTPTPPLTVAVLNAYSGYWRFGYDAVTSSKWTGATSRQQFQGMLDETQVYGAVVDPTPILARGH
ncbi:signal peptidase I [Amnibacterium kyonggiense]|uniref:Signal peptidase I n=1 Tax=Amnibacterium kyonggiense TaxID=595671 RepID=A0A4R7FPX9_9MICO|nr:signal peptidase I [Amnibacterium kyonggiense]TDS79820.1 signal peptidase I [Amnibacterium kyonggiense]